MRKSAPKDKSNPDHNPAREIKRLENQIEFREDMIKQYEAELPKLKTELAKLKGKSK